MAEFIEVREVGLRDGIQNIKTVVPTDLKLAWIKAEVAAGVRDIEVCSFVPPKLLPQFADAEEVTKRALGIPGLTVAALMPNLKGAERGAALGVHRLDYVVSVSESHNLNNVRRSTADSLADLQRIADFLKTIPAEKRPRLLCGLATSFGCTLEGNVPHDRVVQFAEAVAAIGVDEIALADTVGFGNPNAIRTLFKRVRAAIGPKIVLASHFHDTRGLGIANVSAAIEVGVRHFDASLCGLGGCPFAPGATGNIVTEDVVFLAESLGFNTGIDLEKLIKAREIVSQALPSEALYGQMAKAGLPKGFSYADARKAA
ncbi:MAG: hydroxymethylglutaryl-CoA lyase [Hyphomicrobiales bacterium]|jgi:hydroxymethylglutaryl-CoA lyase|nr:hydroxymethylglutaryl-CoA lyase [Hyphomicrobiales bacterium]